ncbi:MAG TPA: hypothetical protein VGO55_03220 [Allosphingosinicella sp.]|nr:hypothetical protein [Allosphingosinicella sp.]
MAPLVVAGSATAGSFGVADPAYEAWMRWQALETACPGEDDEAGRLWSLQSDQAALTVRDAIASSSRGLAGKLRVAREYMADELSTELIDQVARSLMEMGA